MPLLRTKTRAAALFALVTLFTMLVDLATKHAVESLPDASRFTAGFLRVSLAHNQGAAFSLLRNAPDTVRIPLLVGASIVCLAALAALFAQKEDQVTRFGIALVAGGALGNLADRVRLGYVVDFIDASLPVKSTLLHWPTFNIADVAICAGAALLLLGARPLTTFRARSSPS